jgi:hypothetical protein
MKMIGPLRRRETAPFPKIAQGQLRRDEAGAIKACEIVFSRNEARLFPRWFK